MKIRVFFPIIVCGLVLAFVGRAGGDPPVHPRPPRVVNVGVLASLTGSWSSLGHNTVAALQIAEEHLQAEAIGHPGGFRFRFLVRDTQLDPAQALAAIRDLDRRGVKIIIGPQSSSEVAAIKQYADDHNILIISQGSTASSLAIPGDNIFRFCPNDTREAEAIVALMWHDGIRYIVPLWRNDAGNNGLHDSVQVAFQLQGGTVEAGYRYEPTTNDFSTAIASVALQVQTLIGGGTDPSTIAVYLAAFDEVVSVFHTAQGNTTLSNTAWYGSDGVALSAVLPADSVAAAFADNTHYPNPIFGLDDALQNEWQPIVDAIEARTGIMPDAFAVSAYDALFVVQRALEDVGDLRNFAAFKAAFVNEANTYQGVTGSTALDAAGDRLKRDFDFWAVRPQGGGYGWTRTGTYVDGVLTVF